jgi:hypothetical protein
MGNLRDKYTNKEWNEIERELEHEKKLGKPDNSYLAIFVDDLNKDQLINLKYKLLIECNIPKHQCWLIDDWIKYRENKERESDKINN